MPSRKFRTFWLALVLFVLLFAAPPFARAQTGQTITLRVEPSFDGHYKFGEWLPLRLDVTNNGAPVSAELRVDTAETGNQTVRVVPVELPTGTRKQLTLYFMPPSFAKAVRVRVVEGTRELASETAELTLHLNTEYLIGVIASRSEPFNPLKGLTLEAAVSRQVRVIPMTLDGLAERPEGLRVLDAIIISDADTSALRPEQGRALITWVQEGGRLILGGGASAARTLAGLPDGLAADFRSSEAPTEVTSLEGLGSLGEEPVRVPGPFIATWAASGTPIVTQGGRALVSEKRVGEGYVTFSALDLAASPFDAWAGAARFWQKIITPGSAYPMNTPNDISPRLMRTRFLAPTLQNLPVLALPSLSILGALLILYIALVGPINFVILRQLKKLDWGWITIPGLTVLFTVGAFGVSYQLRGGDVVLNQVSVVELRSGDGASTLNTLVGVFSPTRREFSLDIPDPVLVLPVSYQSDPFNRNGDGSESYVQIVTSDRTEVRGIQINQGALQAFAVESPSPASWKIDSQLTVEGDHVRGSIVNHLDAPLADAVLLNGERYVRLGELASNQARTLDEVWQNNYNVFAGIAKAGPSEADARQQILSLYFRGWSGTPELPRRPVIIGWLNSSPLAVRVANTNTAQQASTLVIADVNVGQAQGALHLTRDSWHVELVEGNVMYCGRPAFIGVREGNAVLEFTPIVPFAKLHVTKLTLTIEQANPQTVELLDQSGSWVDLQVDSTGRYAVDDPARFVSPQNVVRLRLSSERKVDRCATYGLELEGTVD